MSIALYYTVQLMERYDLPVHDSTIIKIRISDVRRATCNEIANATSYDMRDISSTRANLAAKAKAL